MTQFLSPAEVDARLLGRARDAGMADAHVLFLGLGYSAAEIARRVLAAGGRVSGTSRSVEGCARITAMGAHAIRFDGETPPAGGLPDDITHIVCSISPSMPPAQFTMNSGQDTIRPRAYVEGEAVAPRDDWRGGESAAVSWDPSLRALHALLADLHALRGVIYLSSVGAYGDHEGAWVDEETPPRVPQRRGRERVLAEADWLSFGATRNIAVQIHRLSGIYGPGRGPGAKLRSGRARRLIKPGHVFNRIHVDDIAQGVFAGFGWMAWQAAQGRAPAQRIFNITDDEPAPPQDVLSLAAELMGLPLPPEVPFDPDALPEMTRSFYAECKRVSNARSRGELRVDYFFPTYREGIPAVLSAEAGAAD